MTLSGVTKFQKQKPLTFWLLIAELLVPMVKAIQELEVRVETLESESLWLVKS